VKIPTLLLAVYQTSTVQFDCQTASTPPALFRLDAASATALIAVPVSPALGTLLTLDPGLYHLQSGGNQCCRIVHGDCAVVVVNGEDPWPTPPLPLKALARYDDALYAYFHAP
jgi:hypothetical protein